MIILRFLLLLFIVEVSAIPDRDVFFQKIAKPLPNWALEQINEDLRPFEEIGITQEAIGKTLRRSAERMLKQYDQVADSFFCRIRIINNNIYTHNSYSNCYFTEALYTLSGLIDLPNIDFILNLSDGTPESYTAQDYWIAENIGDQAPLFGRSKKTWAKYVVVLPDYTAFDAKQLTINTLQINEAYPWSKKIKKAFWRGSRSDIWVNWIHTYSLEEVKALYSTRPRFILSKFSVLYPDLIDAGILPDTYTFASNLNQFLEEENVLKPLCSIQAHIEHAYLPCLDGWSCSYPGYYWRLASNSVVFKNESDQQLWFYKALKPYVHYVPLKYDLSDIFEKIEWAKSNDDLCIKIAETSTQLILDEVTEEDVYIYVYAALKYYESLQRFDCLDLLTETENSKEWSKQFSRPLRRQR